MWLQSGETLFNVLPSIEQKDSVVVGGGGGGGGGGRWYCCWHW